MWTIRHYDAVNLIIAIMIYYCYLLSSFKGSDRQVWDRWVPCSIPIFCSFYQFLAFCLVVCVWVLLFFFRRRRVKVLSMRWLICLEILLGCCTSLNRFADYGLIDWVKVRTLSKAFVNYSLLFKTQPSRMGSMVLVISFVFKAREWISLLSRLFQRVPKSVYNYNRYRNHTSWS